MPTRPLTHAEQAILSLVCEAPRHGYEIEQTIQARDMRAWADLGFSSIYYLLGRLEQRGLVRSIRRASPEGPARRIYRCTPAGAAALRDAVRRALVSPHPGDSPVQLALASLPLLSLAETRRALQRYREHLGQRLDQLRRRRAAQPDLPVHVRAMFARSAALLRAEIRWADSFLARLTKPKPGTRPLRRTP